MNYLTILMLALSAALLGCASKSLPLNGSYHLTKLYETSDFTSTVTVQVSPERISGKGPINNWSGSFIDGKIGMLISTKMAGPESLMEMETRLYQALDGATLTRNGTKLELSQHGEVVAIFRRNN